MKKAQGNISDKPVKRVRVLLSLQLFWLLLVFMLGAWWRFFALKQAKVIAHQEFLLGYSQDVITAHADKVERMLFWEAGSYYILLIMTSAFLIWLFRRDEKRSHGLHAFFASVTHELRTPLTGIRLQAESIADSCPRGAQQEVLVQRLIEDTLRLESQVERTLELARIEGGGMLQLQPLQILPFLNRAVGTWKDASGDHFEIDLKVQDEMIIADVGALEVILKNLVENSIRHSGREKVKISLKTEKKNGQVTIQFSDNGVVSDLEPRKLGTLFLKGRNSRGAGVGLYLVRMLMERMGGSAEFLTRSGFVTILRFMEGSQDA